LKIRKGDNQIPQIEGQKIQRPKEKGQRDKQRSKDRVTRTPLKTGGELMCSGRATNYCSTSGTRRASLDTKH
jgi:hypothetical protein